MRQGRKGGRGDKGKKGGRKKEREREEWGNGKNGREGKEARKGRKDGGREGRKDIIFLIIFLNDPFPHFYVALLTTASISTSHETKTQSMFPQYFLCVHVFPQHASATGRD